MTLMVIEGLAFVIEGDVEADAILASRHLTSPDISTLVRHCFADLPGRSAFRSAQWPIVIATGRFGTGLIRPPLPLVMKAAGVRAVIAPSISPLFVEHSLNSGSVLPLAKALPQWPRHATPVRLSLQDGRATLRWSGHEVVWSCTIPAWSLAGETWIATLQRRAQEAGGLEALQHRLRRAG